MSKRVFISYSHDDSIWRDRLLAALAPVVRKEEIDVWDDRQITAGTDWNAAIEAQLDRSNVAVLLVSARFLSSMYIVEVELPRIVEAAKAGRLTLVWVAVSASLWDLTDLARYQAALDPTKPLDRLSDAQANEALVEVARAVLAGRTLTDVGSGLGIVDAVSDVLEPGHKEFGATARHTGSRVAFVERDSGEPFESITADELKLLPEDDHRLVQSLETRMREEYERWTALYARRTTLTTSEHEQYEESGRQMCKELNNLLDFLEYQLHKHLRDHYGGIRYSCEKLVAGEL